MDCLSNLCWRCDYIYNCNSNALLLMVEEENFCTRGFLRLEEVEVSNGSALPTRKNGSSCESGGGN